MGKVVTELSMSLDGFVAGPNDGPERPWAMAVSGSFSGTPAATPLFHELESTRVIAAPGVTHLRFRIVK